jgi:pyridoxine 5'-phosphate synthase PdxJ
MKLYVSPDYQGFKISTSKEKLFSPPKSRSKYKNEDLRKFHEFAKEAGFRLEAGHGWDNGNVIEELSASFFEVSISTDTLEKLIQFLSQHETEGIELLKVLLKGRKNKKTEPDHDSWQWQMD